VILDTKATVVATLVAPQVEEREPARTAADQNDGVTADIGQRHVIAREHQSGCPEVLGP
jgi:hypothetical protein